MIEIQARGYLVADPTCRTYDKDGKTMKVANFRIGCRDRNGKDHFLNCSAWNSPSSDTGRADVVMSNLCKGRNIWVRGVPTATYGKGKDGTDYANLGVIVNDLEFLDKKPEGMRTTAAAPAAETVPETTAAPAQPAAPQLTPEMIAAFQAFMAQQAASQAQAPAQTPAQPVKEEPAACPDFTVLEEQLPDNLPF